MTVLVTKRLMTDHVTYVMSVVRFNDYYQVVEICCVVWYCHTVAATISIFASFCSYRLK